MLTPELLRNHAQSPQTVAWEGQARMLLEWAADALEAAEQAMKDDYSEHLTPTA